MKTLKILLPVLCLVLSSAVLAEARTDCISFLYTTDGRDFPYPSPGFPYDAFIRETGAGTACEGFDLIEGEGALPQSCRFAITAHVTHVGGAYGPFSIEVESWSRDDIKTEKLRGSSPAPGFWSARSAASYDPPFKAAGEFVARACAKRIAQTAARPIASPAAPQAGAPVREVAPVVDEEKFRRIVQEALEAKDTQAEKPKTIRSSVDRPRYKADAVGQNFAVVIGIEKYSDLVSAPFAERDAEAVRTHLAALGYPERNIVSLTGSRATRSSIVKTLESWLANNAGPASTVFVYFSGHGAPDPKTGQAYLVPWDGDPQFLDDTGYPLKRLYAKLAALPAKRVIVTLDSCFSGAGGRSVLPKGARPLVVRSDMDYPGEGNVVTLTASAADQISGVIEEEGHGLFTYHLLSGLNAGIMTAEGLFGYLAPKVQDQARRRQNRDQQPQIQPPGSSGISLR